MMDKETRTIWDPISGEAFKGPFKGTKLNTWPVFVTNVDAQLSAQTDTQLFISAHRSPLMWFMQFTPLFMGVSKRGFLAPNFHLSMSKPIDPRLPKLTQGVGVIMGKHTKYYPLNLIPPGKGIRDQWNDRTLIIDRSGKDKIPRAAWEENNEMPMQLLSRWYGFSFTYPDCEIYTPGEDQG